MLGPGEYVPDATQGITRIEDLAPPKIFHRSRNFRRRPCPACGHSAYRDRTARRTLHDLGHLASDRPHDLRLTYSQHYCSRCRTYFNVDMSGLAPPGGHHTHRVVRLAVRLVVEDGLPYRVASWHLWRDHRVFVPFATIQNWVEAGGGKAQPRVEADYLEWALADFPGYLAADELYDGPFCVLSLVDNRAFKRLAYEVLDHDPTHGDIEAFLGRFKASLDQRALAVRGVTTDGSPLYPEPIRKVFGAVPHQVCEFHVLAELTRAILRAAAKVRKELAARKPKLPRGRPTTAAARKAARAKRRIEDKVGALFEHRYLFVQHYLGPKERELLRRITRGLPQLRTLRGVMDEAYRLFDRRCRTDTALAKLDVLRRRIRRFRSLGKTLNKLFSPTLEKALVFLDDKLLPSTSNAVERGNRRYRKMQRSVYRIRTQDQLRGRVALDMLREAEDDSQQQTLATLHGARKGATTR